MTTIDVIVPVYRGVEATRRCIESVLSTASSTVHQAADAVRADRGQRRLPGARACSLAARTRGAFAPDSDRAAAAPGFRRGSQPRDRASPRARRRHTSQRRRSRQRLARSARRSRFRRARHRHRRPVHQLRRHRRLPAHGCQERDAGRAHAELAGSLVPPCQCGLLGNNAACAWAVRVLAPRVSRRGGAVRRRSAGQRLRRRAGFLSARVRRRIPARARRRCLCLAPGRDRIRIRRCARPRGARRESAGQALSALPGATRGVCCARSGADLSASGGSSATGGVSATAFAFHRPRMGRGRPSTH